MNWRDQLRPARLGDVAFLVDAGDGQLGRNTQVHEYPLRDTPYVEDLGRRARRFTLDAYVIGPDYMVARDALIAEIEKPGPRTLVHPYMGEMRVSVVEFSGPRESTREGGMARFSLTVVEGGERTFPSATRNTTAAVIDTAGTAINLATSSFSAGFGVQGFPSFVSQDAQSLTRRFAIQLSDIVRTVTTVPSAVSTFVADLGAVSGSVGNLVLTPATFALNVVSLIGQLRTIGSGPVEALALVRELFGFGSDISTVSTGTASRDRQISNQSAFVALVQQAATIEAARIAADVEFASFEDALELRTELVEQIDTLTESASSDAVYYALVDVRTAIARDIEARGADLARQIRLTLNDPLPAIVLAYRLYADATLDADIVARNAVSHPLALPSGVPLEVLSNA